MTVKHIKMKRHVLLVSLAATALICYRMFYAADVDHLISMRGKIPDVLSTSMRRSDARSTSNDRHDVLIISYMRSGSTITGHLLGHREDAFYFYEPFLADLTHSYLSGKDEICQYFNPTCRQLNGVVHKALDFLRDIYSCSFKNSATLRRMFTNTNSDFTARRSGRRWNDFIECKHRHGNNTFDDCVERLISTCRDAKHKVAKVLRLSLDSTEQLLSENSKLNIVYLLRDPRGIIASEIKTKWFPFTGKTQQSVSDNAKTLCSRMSNDIAVAKRLTKLYPNRVKLILYEDFGDQVGLANKLYEFAGMGFNKTFVENFARTTDTSAATTKSDGFHPSTYRNNLPWNTVKIIDSVCSYVYSEIGYPHFKKEYDLRNENTGTFH